MDHPEREDQIPPPPTTLLEEFPNISQEVIKGLKRDLDLLREEVNGLKTQMSLIIQILLKREDNLPLFPPQANMTLRPWVISPHQQQPRQQAPPHSGNQNRSQRPQFDPIPITYAELLPALIEKNLVQTRAPPPVPAKLPWWYKPDLSCAFHQGAPGHDVERCLVLRSEVQKLTRANILSFKDLNPNVQANPLPNR
jgi:hypothetical protein